MEAQLSKSILKLSGTLLIFVVLLVGCEEYPLHVRSVEEQSLIEQKERQRLADTAAMNPVRPKRWPVERSWHPRRHFGSIRSGSDLSQIQIRLHLREAYWYFNDFFDTIEANEQAVYSRYYKPTAGSNWPQDDTPEMEHLAAGPLQRPLESVDKKGWANEVLLSLVEMNYSSRYGGSFELIFRLADVPHLSDDRSQIDDFEYEFGKRIVISQQDGTIANEDYLFDVGDLEMRLFAKPDKNLVNPTHVLNWNGLLQVEFDVRSFVAYRNHIALTGEEGIEVLEGVLQELAVLLPSKDIPTIGQEAIKFSHALLHLEHQEKISTGAPPDKVTRLLVSDDFSDITTARTEPYILVFYKIEDLYWRGGEDEIEGWISVLHFFEGEKEPRVLFGRRIAIRVPQNGSSSWYFVGGFHTWECEHIEKIEVTVRVDSIDAITDLGLDCPPILAQAAQTNYAATVPNAVTGDDSTFYRGDGILYGETSFLSGGQGHGNVRWIARVDVVPR